jgi:hypothetical protein
MGQARLPVESPRADDVAHDPIARRWDRVREHKTAAALFIAVAVVTLPYWSVLVAHNSAMYGDINDVFVPAYVAVWRAILHGHAPWWTPNVFGGHSMVGAGQYAVFYPLNAIFGVLRPVVAYRVWMFVHLWIATAGAFWWSLRRFSSRFAAIVSGVAYSCSGFVVLQLVHPPFVIAAAWLPFAFCGVDMLREQWTTRRAFLLAGAIALIAFGGQPQMVWLAGLGIASYTFALTVLDRGDARERWLACGRVAVASLLGLGIAAVQLLPLWLFSRTSVRSSLTTQAALSDSVLPHDLWTLLFPYAFGGSAAGPTFSAQWLGGYVQREVGLFAGCTVLALAAIAVTTWRRDAGVRAFSVMALFALLLALGGSTPFGRFAFRVLPFANQFRDWGRASLLLNLAFAMLAGAGVRALLEAPRRYMYGVWIGYLAVAATGLVLLPMFDAVRNILVGGSYLWIARGLPLLCLLVFAVGVGLMTRNRRMGALVVLVTVAFEVMTFAFAAEWRGDAIPVASLDAFYSSKAPDFGVPYNAPGGVDRWLSNSYGFRMVSLAKNMNGVNGFDPLLQKEWATTVGGFEFDGAPTSSAFWAPGWLADVLRVSTLVLSNDVTPTDPSWRRGASVPNIGFTRWVRDPRLPEAYLSGDVKVASLTDIARALVDPNTHLDRTTFVEDGRGAIGRISGRGPVGTVASADVLGSGRVVVDARRNALLVLSHDWEDGWHATVDGHEVPVVRANGLVLGVPVPPGHHVIRLGFRPPGLLLGAVLSIISVLTLFAVAPLASWVRRLRRSGEPEE